MKKLISMVALLSLFISGCASIASDSEYQVLFDTQPSGAYFEISTNYGDIIANGVTPQRILLPASDGFFKAAEYRITYQLDGYGNKEVLLKSTVDGWIVGNVVVGGIPGLIIDGATGAMFALPERVVTTLPQLAQSKGIAIMALADLPAELHSQLLFIE